MYCTRNHVFKQIQYARFAIAYYIFNETLFDDRLIGQSINQHIINIQILNQTK